MSEDQSVGIALEQESEKERLKQASEANGKSEEAEHAVQGHRLLSRAETEEKGSASI